MHVLLTRPDHQAERSKAELKRRGHQVSVDPLLTIEPVLTAPPEFTADAIAVTSINALNALARHPQFEAMTDATLYAVGDRTAQRAREIGFHKTLSAAGNAGDLAQLLANARRDSKIQSVFYPSAEQTAFDLEAALQTHDLSCTRWIAYRIKDAAQFSPDTVTAFQSATIDFVLLYSARTAACFSKLWKQQCRNFEIPAIATISPSVSDALSPDLRARSRSAKEPNETSLLAQLPDG